MYYTTNLRNIFAAITVLVIGAICFTKIGIVDIHSILSTGAVLVPAVIVMGYLGKRIGEIIDNPKNIDDADYKLAVLNALKKMDKTMTMQDLNEKLSKSVTESDTSETDDDVDL